jgi:GDP-L-fucose synthase
MSGVGPEDTVVHLAGRVGGIIANSAALYEFFYDNAAINLNVLHECRTIGVRRLVAVSSTCAYPAECDHYPMVEGDLHRGPPEPTNRGYAYAKRLLPEHVSLVRECDGLDWSTIYCSNLYGPGDNFDPDSCHVIPALIRRAHKAKLDGAGELRVLGTGNPLRQFTYIDDFARFLPEYALGGLVGDFNFTAPGNIAIRDLAQAIATTVGYRGALKFVSGPDGVMRKDVSASVLQRQMELVFTSFADGLAATYQWYLRHVEARGREEVQPS